MKVPIAGGGTATAINFDNAATTPPFHAVMNRIVDFAPWYSSVHRGKGYKSVLSSDLYEKAREMVHEFIGADPSQVVIFTKNTTESANLLAHVLRAIRPEQIILSTEMEHLANDLPWRTGFKTDYVRVDSDGRLSLPNLEAKLRAYQGKVGLVAVSGASNVTGYMNPLSQIARTAHRHGAKIFVDAAQLASHAPIDMKPVNSPDHIDYLAFSAHKMYAPFGIGVLIGPMEDFTQTEPLLAGGGAVGLVSRQFVEWGPPPARHEAGTPNIIGLVALTAAIATLNSSDLRSVHAYENGLIRYAINGMKAIPGLTLYCIPDQEQSEVEDNRVSLISFSLKEVSHGLLAEILSGEAGIAVRNGLFCAHPYVEKLLGLTQQELEYYHAHEDIVVPGLVRISFGLYNTSREVDIFIDLLTRIARNPRRYIEKYTQRCMPGNVYC
ncbi:cysteine desulfurase [Acetonema longum DSM 6540]|uniref:Cysteine desulfurase n=1 Tax=Acetonema longum DSM 6540 TaxID=1009370 RepID=F7NPA0_9FIRM|nr:cysteine desulfurase [Acetonema longum DSM 6540]